MRKEWEREERAALIRSSCRLEAAEFACSASCRSCVSLRANSSFLCVDLTSTLVCKKPVSRSAEEKSALSAKRVSGGDTPMSAALAAKPEEKVPKIVELEETTWVAAAEAIPPREASRSRTVVRTDSRSLPSN